MKTSIIIFTVLAVFSLSALCQKTLTYEGKFEDGLVKYHYYETEKYDRFLHGEFTYNGNIFKVVGNYKNDLKHGLWTISAKNQIVNNEYYYGKIKISAFVKGMFNDGMLDGNWQYKNEILMFSSIDGKCELPPGDTEISYANFKNNKFCGKISYQRSFEKLSIEGEFGNDGMITGEWILNHESIDIIKFNKGIAYWRLKKEGKTGEKILLIDSTKFVEDFWTNYDQKSKVAVIRDELYRLDTVFHGSVPCSDNGVVKLETDDNYPFYSKPMSLWTNSTIEVYHSGFMPNPLYYPTRGSISPIYYELVIVQCKRNDAFCKEKYVELDRIKQQQRENEIRLEKERQAVAKLQKEKELKNQQLNKELVNTYKELAALFKTLTERNEKLKEEQSLLENNLKSMNIKYPSKYRLSMNYLQEKFARNIDEFKMPNMVFGVNVNEWTSESQTALETLKKNILFLNSVNSLLTDCISFHEKVERAYKTNDKAKLKVLKKYENPIEIVNAFIFNRF